MKTIKVSEATGRALDWLVWVCAGGAAAYPKTASGPAFLKLWRSNTTKYVHPSTDWAQGGPIIEREGITCGPWDTSPAMAHYGTTVGNGVHRWVGPTPLVAGMRCFAINRLGETAEVPEELL